MDLAEFINPRSAREMYSRAGWTIGFAIVLYFINRAEYPGPAALLAAVIVLIGLVFGAIGYGLTWISTEGQRRAREQLLTVLDLQGSERVLSLSHELGIEAAKRLKSGRVISLGDSAANEAAREVAKQAGLGDKIRFESGDVCTKLSYPDSNFDAVLTSGNLSGGTAGKSLKELSRVLKPGARIALHEFLDYREQLANAGFAPNQTAEPFLPLGVAGRIFIVQKL